MWTDRQTAGRWGLALADTDLISKTPPLLLRRLDIRSLGVGIAFIARLRGGAPHSPLSHTHCDLGKRQKRTETGWEDGKEGETSQVRVRRQSKIVKQHVPYRGWREWRGREGGQRRKERRKQIYKHIQVANKEEF